MDVRTFEMSSFFCLRVLVVPTGLPVRFFAYEHNTQDRQQTTQYSTRAESVVNPSCIQHCNPAVQQQQHSGQSRTRVADLHAAVLLWPSAFFSDPRSIIQQQHTSLSDAVRGRAIVQHVGAVAHSRATPATYINTSSAESLLTAS